MARLHRGHGRVWVHIRDGHDRDAFKCLWQRHEFPINPTIPSQNLSEEDARRALTMINAHAGQLREFGRGTSRIRPQCCA